MKHTPTFSDFDLQSTSRLRSLLNPWRVALAAFSIFLIPHLASDSLRFSNAQAQQVQPDDAKRIKVGRAKAQGCTRCHGRNGIERLATASGWTGPVGSFVTQQLTALRNGSLHHAVMTDVAKVLTDEDIRDISAWVQSMADRNK